MRLRDIAEKYNLDLTELACALGVIVGKELGPEEEVELTADVVAGIKDFLGVDVSEESSEDVEVKEEGIAEVDKKKDQKGGEKEPREGREKAKREKLAEDKPVKGRAKRRKKKQSKPEEAVEESTEESEEKEERQEKQEKPEAATGEKENVKDADSGSKEEDVEKAKEREEPEAEAKVEAKTEVEDLRQEQGSPHQEAIQSSRGAEEEAVQEETPGGEDEVPEGVGDERAVLLGEAAPPPSSTTINIKENSKLEVKEETVDIDESLLEVEPTEEEAQPTPPPESEPVPVQTIESPQKQKPSLGEQTFPPFIGYVLIGIALLCLLLVIAGIVKLNSGKVRDSAVSSIPKYTDAELFAIMYRMLEKGSYATVEDLFSELRANFPDSKFIDDAAIYIGDMFFDKREDLPKQERYDKAIEYYQIAYEISSRRFNKEKALLQIAHSLFKKEDYATAIEKYKQFLNEFPIADKADEAQFYLSLAYYQLSDRARAALEFWKLIGKYKNSPYKEKSYYYLVKIYFEQNDYEKVANIAPVFMKDYPKSQNLSEVLFMYADALIKLGKVDEAIKAYSDAENNLSEDLLPSLLFRKAKAYELKGDKESAVEVYLDLADRFKYDKLAADALDRAAELLTDLDRLEKAVEVYYQLKERFYKWDKLPFSIYKLARVLAREGRFQEAEKWLRFVLKKYPKYPKRLLVLWRLARVLELEGKYIDAVKVYDKILAILPQEDQARALKVYLAKADALLRAKQYRKAIGVFIAILTKFKRYEKLERGKILYRLSVAYFYNGDYAKAIDSFKDAISSSPLNPWRFRCRYMLGRTYEEVGEIESAIEQYLRIVNNRFLGDRSLKSLAWQSLGRINYRLGKYDEAYEAFRQARALTSDWWRSTELLKLQADCLLGKKEFGSAVKLYAKYMDRLLQYYQAKIAEDEQGKFSIVIGRQEEEGFEKIAGALTRIADTHFRMGAYATALKVYKRVKGIYEDRGKPVPDWVLFQIGMCYKGQGNMEEAKQVFSQLQKTHPDSLWAKEANWQMNEIEILERLNRAKRLLQEVTK